jgi:ribose 5-phosphate isomerase RpiB
MHIGIGPDHGGYVLCLGQRGIGSDLAWDLGGAFPAVRFMGERQHHHRVTDISNLERDRALTEVRSGL